MSHGNLRDETDLSAEFARSRDVPLSARLLNAAIGAAEAEDNSELVTDLLDVKQREAQRKFNMRIDEFPDYME